MKTETILKTCILSALTGALSSANVQALDFPQGFTLEENGALRLGNVVLTLKAANLSWFCRDNFNWTDIQTETGDGFRAFSGTAPFPTVKIRTEERIEQTGENRYRYEGAFHFPEPTQMNGLYAELLMPYPVEQLVLDGKVVPIPELQGPSPELVASRPFRTLSVKGWGGTSFTITGNLKLMMQDNRQWGNNTAIARIFVSTPPLAPRTWKDAEIAFDLQVDSPSAVPVALGAGANRSLSDADGSGWLGEGAESDLKALKAGTLTLAQFPFEIAPERKAIVTGRGFSDGAVGLALPAGTRAGAVTLLHAADWPLLAGWQPEKGKPVGFIDVAYADGKTESIPVKTDIDCSHWKTVGMPFPNAVPAFIGEADGAPAGLYASSFALAQDDPVSLSFRPAFPENTAWMIAAVTLSSRAAVFPPTVKRTAFTLRENAQWKRLDFSGKTVPGSALDFSSFGLQDAPAGKYGAVCVNDKGEFTFENAPEKRVRFYGANLCFSANFQDKEAVDQLVERMAAVGYNTLRIHHHDNRMIDPDAPDSVTLDPEQMDKLDYLVAKCKEKGIYIATDIFVSRKLRPGDNIGIENPDTLSNMKGLLPVSDAAMNNWKEFARRWMTHRNPYTGLTWAEEPALAILGMVNEIFVTSSWGRDPELTRLYREKYEEWKREKNISEETGATFEAFLKDLVDRVYREMITFIRDELKVKAMLTGDCTTSPFERDDWDFVDAHTYFAHPSFPEKAWTTPIQFDTGSSLKRGVPVPGSHMRRRIYEKPLTFTEINFCAPNPHRAESGPLTGAFAARQNWGGLWRFAWSHGGYINPWSITQFDACNDPLSQFSDRIVAALYLREDLPVAATRLTIGSGDAPQTLSSEMRALGLQAQIGFSMEGKPLPPDVRPYTPGMEIPDDGCVRYDVKAGTLAVMTDRTETVTLPGGSLEADVLRIRHADGFMTVAAISRDGKPLAESSDILVLHLTNVFNNNARYDREDIVRAWGDKGRPLVERKTAQLELKADAPWRVAALATDGSEFGTVQTEFQDGVFRFLLDPACFDGGVMAYHLTR